MLQIIPWYVSRWNIEVTFEEARAHLGLETQRQSRNKISVGEYFSGSLFVGIVWYRFDKISYRDTQRRSYLVKGSCSHFSIGVIPQSIDSLVVGISKSR
jgi:hypothetical protein